MFHGVLSTLLKTQDLRQPGNFTVYHTYIHFIDQVFFCNLSGYCFNDVLPEFKQFYEIFS